MCRVALVEFFGRFVTIGAIIYARISVECEWISLLTG